MAETDTGRAGGDPGAGFTMTVSQNKYLAQQVNVMEAVVSVAARGLGRRPGPAGSGPDAAEVILVDCSGSMDVPRTKMPTARRATRAAVDALHDGVMFAVVAGTHGAAMAYPDKPALVPASPATKAEAKVVVNRLLANGGTAIGTWLDKAADLLAEYPAAVRHAMLFTDGRNEHETRQQLDTVLDRCRGRFVCDPGGIGEEWEPDELLRIVEVLNGQAKGVPRLTDMVDDFRALMQAAMRKVVPDVDLRIRTMINSRLRYVKQAHPTMVDLAPHRVQLDELTAEFATGSWADEKRDYQVCVEVDGTDRPF